MADNIITTIFFIWPILLGAIIWLAKLRPAANVLDWCDSSTLNFRAKAESSTGYFGKFWLRPASRVLLIPARSTNKIGDAFLRYGVKAALYPYTVAFIAIATLIEAELLLLFGCFIAIFAIWGLFERLTGNQHEGGTRTPRKSEQQCPDCNSVKVNPFLNEGDGKCSVCHGTGEGGMLDQLADATNPFGRQGTKCFKCHGTGQCQSCGGHGVVYA